MLTRAMNTWIGNPEDKAGWDIVEPFPDCVKEELEHWGGTLLTAAWHKHPMWLLRPAQLLQLHQEGRGGVDAHLETEASLAGFRAILRLRTAEGWEEH